MHSHERKRPPNSLSRRLAAGWCLALVWHCAFEGPAAASGQSPVAGDAAGRSGGTVTLQLQWHPQAQFAGYMLAESREYFRQAGLDNVKLVWGSDEVRPIERLVGGEVTFCTAWLSTAISERAQGRPVVHIAQILQRSSMMLVTRSDSGIARPADMSGRRLGLWGGEFDVLPHAFFKKHAVRPAIVPQSNSMVPFLRGAVDVASAMYYNEYHQLREAGLQEDKLRIFPFADFGMDFPEDGIYCTEATLGRRPATCAALVTAVRQGWHEAFANEPETLETVMDYCARARVRTNRAHQRWMLRSMRQAMTGLAGKAAPAWGGLSREAYAEVAGALLDQGLIDRVPEFSAFHRPPALRHNAR